MRERKKGVFCYLKKLNFRLSKERREKKMLKLKLSMKNLLECKCKRSEKSNKNKNYNSEMMTTGVDVATATILAVDAASREKTRTIFATTILNKIFNVKKSKEKINLRQHSKVRRNFFLCFFFCLLNSCPFLRLLPSFFDAFFMQWCW